MSEPGGGTADDGGGCGRDEAVASHERSSLFSAALPPAGLGGDDGSECVAPCTAPGVRGGDVGAEAVSERFVSQLASLAPVDGCGGVTLLHPCGSGSGAGAASLRRQLVRVEPSRESFEAPPAGSASGAAAGGGGGARSSGCSRGPPAAPWFSSSSDSPWSSSWSSPRSSSPRLSSSRSPPARAPPPQTFLPSLVSAANPSSAGLILRPASLSGSTLVAGGDGARTGSPVDHGSSNAFALATDTPHGSRGLAGRTGAGGLGGGTGSGAAGTLAPGDSATGLPAGSARAAGRAHGSSVVMENGATTGRTTSSCESGSGAAAPAPAGAAAPHGLAHGSSMPPDKAQGTRRSQRVDTSRDVEEVSAPLRRRLGKQRA